MKANRNVDAEVVPMSGHHSLIPDRAIPKADEPAVMMCLVCRHREVHKSLRAAKRALNIHNNATGHAIGTFFARAKGTK